MYSSFTGDPGVQPHHTTSPDVAGAEPVESLVAALRLVPSRGHETTRGRHGQHQR